MAIHPSAIVDPKAEIDPSVEIGPHAVVQGRVRIGPGCRLMPGACIFGDETEIGENNLFHVGSVIGGEPQHLAYDGAPRALRIGSGNIFREYVTIHRAFVEGGETRIGNDCFFMVSSHVAHDCTVGNNVVMANNSVLGGHAHIADRVNISGNCAVHQNCRVGRCAMLQGGSVISQDLPPFFLAAAGCNIVGALNTIGMRRAGIGPEARKALQRAFHTLYRSGLGPGRAREALATQCDTPEVAELLEFIQTSKRGILSHYRGDA